MSVEAFLDNYGPLADAPNGVRKLLALILQLAVQGKLVPQDPKDEPAAKLLERIKKEKGAKGSRRGRACPAQGAASGAPSTNSWPCATPSKPSQPGRQKSEKMMEVSGRQLLVAQP